jgi:ribosomal protein S18 acetylase RimI-like enzyme
MSDSGFSWRRLDSDDAEALKAFLLSHEDYAAGFSGRILKDGELRIPGFPSGAVFGLCGGDELRGAVLWSPYGMVFPIFDEVVSAEQGECLSRLLQGGKTASMAGAARHVLALEEALKIEPRLRVRYRSMYRSSSDRACAAPSPADTATLSMASPEDFRELVPLHAAYEREEVMTALHRFDPDLSRAGLRRILSQEMVAVARREGRVVATARTNARGLRTWQIGGVYVVPELRAQGWGRYVVGFLVDRIAENGKSVSLFVKEGNAPAIGLYRSMGFEDLGAYSVDYL